MADKILSKDALRKKYYQSNRADIILPKEEVLRLPSRVLPFNHQIGGGIPYGKMMELFGWESTGKSLLAQDFAYCTQYMGGHVLWGDMENAWSNSWAEQIGLDPSKIELLDGCNSIEVFSDWAKDACMSYRSELKNNEPILLVCDSVAAGETTDNLEGDQGSKKAEMGSRAKAWDKMYRMRIPLWKKLGITVIMINQLRGKIGASMFESAETTPGGKSAAYYASIRIGLQKGTQIKGRLTSEGYVDDKMKGRKCGNRVTTQVRKNKTSPPTNSVKTEVYFTEIKKGYVGYNKYMGLDEIAMEEGVITKKGNTYSVGKKKVAGKKDDVILAIENSSKLRRHIVNKLGINTISKTMDRAENVNKNLYKL